MDPSASIQEIPSINILSLPYIKVILAVSAALIIGELFIRISTKKNEYEKRYKWRKKLLTAIFAIAVTLIILPWLLRWFALLGGAVL